MTNNPKCIEGITDQLASNPDCQLGFFNQGQRVAYTKSGPNSHLGDEELLAIISNKEDYWYGQIVRISPEAASGIEDKNTAGSGDWLAQLVCTSKRIDGTTLSDVLTNTRLESIMCGCLIFDAYERSDGFALRTSFPNAAQALEEMIRRFSLRDLLYSASTLERALSGDDSKPKSEPKMMLNAFEPILERDR